MEKNGTYVTSDIYVAAWLLSNGLHIKGIDRHNPQRSDFIFQDRGDRPELVRQFVCGSATGSVADFVYKQQAVWKDLKRLGYSVCSAGRYQTSARIYGKSRWVVKLRAAVLQGEGDLPLF